MALDEVASRGLVLLGCGKMGSALLRGWLDRGLPPGAVYVIEPRPSDWLRGTGVALDGPLPQAPAVALVAVKPQMMGEALPAMISLGGGRTLVVSIAAGTPLSAFEAAFGEVVRLEREGQMDAVTAVSGSGPAYVFHMIEALAAAGEAEGLSPELSLRLARATVAGAGALAQETGTDPAQLRRDVTSPNGTTQAGLGVLMDAEAGLVPLIRRTVRAAAKRSEELGRG